MALPVTFPTTNFDNCWLLTTILRSVCAELKERCYERGAEDNLTVVVVRVGRTNLMQIKGWRIWSPRLLLKHNQSLPRSRMAIRAAPAVSDSSFVPPSRIAFPAPATDPQPVVAQEKLNVAAPTARKKVVVQLPASSVFCLFWHDCWSVLRGRSLQRTNSVPRQPNKGSRSLRSRFPSR